MNMMMSSEPDSAGSGPPVRCERRSIAKRTAAIAQRPSWYQKVSTIAHSMTLLTLAGNSSRMEAR